MKNLIAIKLLNNTIETLSHTGVDLERWEEMTPKQQDEIYEYESSIFSALRALKSALNLLESNN